MSRMDTTLITMDTHHKALAERITAEVKGAMKERGVSQRKLSSQTGIPLNTLNARLQSGTTRPFTVGELACVLDALNLSLTEIALRAERSMVSA